MAKVQVDVLLKDGTDETAFINDVTSNDEVDLYTETFNPQNKNDPHFAVKIVGYPKRENYGMYDDVRRPENAELNMLKVLSYFVINNQTPHLVLPIGTFDTDIKPFLFQNCGVLIIILI